MRWQIVSGWMMTMSFALVACGGESSSDGDPSGGSAGTAGSTGGGGSGGAGGSTGGSPSGGGAPSGGGSAGVAGSAGAGATCGGPGTTTCSKPSDCVLATDNCCLCGTPEITDYMALNQAAAATCACQGPACGCATMENPNLATSCESGSCQGWDVRQREDLSGCKTDTDCRLRNGIACCEPCLGSEYQLIAIASQSESVLKTLRCDGNEGCPKCLQQYPPNKTAKCVANRCQVADI